MGLLWSIYRDTPEDRKRKEKAKGQFDRAGRSRDEQLAIRARYREQRKKYTDVGLMIRKA